MPVSYCRSHNAKGVVKICELFSVLFYGNETWQFVLFSSAVVSATTFLLDSNELQLNIYFGRAS